LLHTSWLLYVVSFKGDKRTLKIETTLNKLSTFKRVKLLINSVTACN
jgi:hypothetical protein